MLSKRTSIIAFGGVLERKTVVVPRLLYFNQGVIYYMSSLKI